MSYLFGQKTSKIELMKIPRKTKARFKLTRHHDINKSRGGRTRSKNIIILKQYKHQGWHALFGNKTLDEAIEVLKRLQQRRG